MLPHLPAAAILALVGTPGDAQERRVEQPRTAAGDLAVPGGARRLRDDQTSAQRDAGSRRPVQNVILLIGDGMGDSEITIARNYAQGAGGAFPGIDALPHTGHITHYSLNRETGLPNYVTDSAASATAWASGVKTYNGGIGVDIRGQPHATLLQRAKAAGMATGNVTTSELQDATPAAQFAHVVRRECFGPVATTRSCPDNAIENGGAGSITEQALAFRPDVMLGGGARTFAESAAGGQWRGRTLMDQAQARGYRIVRDAAGLQAVTTANQRTPLIGLFADAVMPVRWLGPLASHRGSLDRPPVTCTENPDRVATIPTLETMTRKAIELLRERPQGFLLQVEGASIDKQAHAANPCGQIGETVDLDEAVQAALEFARTDGRTLVIVTADHAHTSQIVSNAARAPGLTASLNTRDGAVMTVSYGTAEEGASQGHTGTQLRVAAYGPEAERVTGLIDQTDLFYIIRDVLRLK